MSALGDGGGPPLPDPIFPLSPADEVADELQFHLDMRTRQLIALGMAPDVARRAAADQFRDLDRVHDECRHLAQQREHTMRRSRYLANLVQDGRFALRMLRRRAAFALLAIVTIALGIGAATAIYSVVDGVMLRPLPFPRARELVAVWMTNSANRKTSALAWDHGVVGGAQYAALQSHATHLRGVAMWQDFSTTLVDASGTEQIATVRVTSSLLPLLGRRPVVGRGFGSGDDVPNGPKVAMLSWESWQQRFGGDSTVIGRSISLGADRYTVIGVLPRGLRLDRTRPAAAIWTPALQGPMDMLPGINQYHAIARVAPGATVTQITAEVAQILRATAPAVVGDTIGAYVDSWQADENRDIHGSLWILLATVTLLLLVACTNVATLTVSEAARREGEMAARMALGAPISRLVRQLLAESLTIAVFGGILGVAVAWIGSRILVLLAPASIPGLADVRLDGRVLLFAAGCTALTAIVFGVAPAFTLLTPGNRLAAPGSARHSARGAGSWQRALIAAEVALALVLLTGCALLDQSLRELSTVDPGFDPSNVIVFQLRLPPPFWTDSTRAIQYYAAARQQLSALPGVTAVSNSSTVPFAGGGLSDGTLRVEGKAYLGNEAEPQAWIRTTSPGFFQALRIPLVAGRDFTEQDRTGNEPVAIISETMAHRGWSNQSPIGQRLLWRGQHLTVVGVVHDVKIAQLTGDAEATLYLPYEQLRNFGLTLVVRVRGNAAGFVPELRNRLKAIDPTVAIVSTDPLSQLVERSYGKERFRAFLASLFGVLAGILVAVGIFGVTARTVAGRMSEAGIRAALGAPARALTWLMMRDTLTGVAIGLLAGLPGALLVSRLLAPYLFRVTPRDPFALGLALLLIVGASLLATLQPARRIGRVDPVTVMRSE